MLPVCKVKADGVHKKGAILDIEKLSKILREELSPPFGQYTEAVAQMFNFQAQRDKDLPSDWETWTQFWELHFLFFKNQHDAEEYYEEWKHIELDLRQEHWSYGYTYDPEYYVQHYMTTKNNMIQRLQLDEEMNWGEAKFCSLFEWKPRSRDAPYGGNSSRFSSNKPFPEAGSRPSAPSSCVLCANRSHTLFSHPCEKTKFLDAGSSITV